MTSSRCLHMYVIKWSAVQISCHKSSSAHMCKDTNWSVAIHDQSILRQRGLALFQPLSGTNSLGSRLAASDQRNFAMALWALVCKCGTDKERHSSLVMMISNLPPLLSTSPSYALFTACFKRYNSLAACPCFQSLCCKILGIINVDSVESIIKQCYDGSLLTADRMVNANLNCRERCSSFTSVGFRTGLVKKNELQPLCIVINMVSAYSSLSQFLIVLRKDQLGYILQPISSQSLTLLPRQKVRKQNVISWAKQ